MNPSAEDHKGNGKKWRKIGAAVLALVVATVAFLANVAQIGTAVKEIFTPATSSQTEAHAPSSGSKPGTSAPELSSVPTLPPRMDQIGHCLTVEGPVSSCEGVHSAEVFATAPSCSSESLLKYAGGAVQGDVLRSDLAVQLTEDKNFCMVVLPEDLHDFGTLRNGLLSEGHAALRRCFDRIKGSDVPCDTLHTAEIVSIGAPLSPSDCKMKSDQYMNASVDQHFRILEVTVKTVGASAICVVSARGNNGLIGSLRNTNSKAIQVQALP